MVLVVAEKPSVARDIAKVIGATKRKKGYYEGKGYYVSWCVGHLIELAEPAIYNDKYKKWEIEDLPIIPGHFKTKINKNTAEQFKVLKDLMNKTEVKELIEATDAGREGELIFRLVYEKAGCTKPFKRLWISSMEEKSIKEGLANMKPGHKYDNLYKAALCRQRADWLVGINLTRLYSTMYSKTLPCGRVQTPTINLIVERQREIENFIPKTYYSLTADLSSFKAYARVDNKEKAEKIIVLCTGKKAIVKNIDKQEKKENPAGLYDLTKLQREANRLLGYTSQQTLDYLQNLYDNKLATYPRTDSQYITKDQEQPTFNLIKKLLGNNVYSTIVLNNYSTSDINMQRIVNDKKVTDHHAILPTESITKEKLEALPTGEKNIITLILYRLIEAVYLPYVYTATKVILDIEGQEFIASGREIKQQGYKLIEDQLRKTINTAKEKEEKPPATLPQIEKGSTHTVKNIEAEEKKTQPPKAYTEDTLLAAMETAGKNITDQELREAMKDSGLGTPATRAGIIENIIRTNYIKRKGKILLPTEKAYTFIDLVTEKIKRPELTAEWEKQLAKIQRGEIEHTEFLYQVTSFINSFVCETKAHYSPEKTKEIFKSERENIGICPKCNNKVAIYPKSYSCENWKKGCDFRIWNKIAGKAITKAQAIKLLNKGKTDLIKGFKSKTGNSFEAYLILKENNEVGFYFPPRKEQKNE